MQARMFAGLFTIALLASAIAQAQDAVAGGAPDDGAHEAARQGAMRQDRRAPAPDCLDAHDVALIRQSGVREVDVVTHDNTFHRITTAEDCPGIGATGVATLLAPDGWVCNGQRALIRHESATCTIASIEASDAQAFAAEGLDAEDMDADLLAHAGQGAADGARTLDAVEVHEQKPRPGFSRSTETCFAPRYLQSWSEDKDGITVRVSRRHPGEHRQYRVRTGSCSDLSVAHVIEFRSRLGNGGICGRPGDRVLPLPKYQDPFTPPPDPLSAVPNMGCPVFEVHPVM